MKKSTKQGNNTEGPRITMETDLYNKGREMYRHDKYINNIKLYSNNSTHNIKNQAMMDYSTIICKILIFALFTNMPFKFMDKILSSRLMDLPFDMIDNIIQ